MIRMLSRLKVDDVDRACRTASLDAQIVKDKQKKTQVMVIPGILKTCLELVYYK